MLNLCGKNPLHILLISEVAGKLARGNGRKHSESLSINRSNVRDKILVLIFGSDLVRDFSMRDATVLQDEHAVIAFQVAEENNDVPIVSVLGHG